MGCIVAPFEVSSRALAQPVKCRFVRLLSGIATRHSDTMDCFFHAGGQKVTVAISCPAITGLRERDGRQLTDQQLAEISALYLRRTLEQGYDPASSELFVGEADLRALAQNLHFLP